MNIPDNILIVGLGTTGISIARYLGSLGKKITITDQKGEAELAKSLEALGGVAYRGAFGGHRREDFLDHPLIIISPGVDSEFPLLREARGNGAEVLGEIEFASQLVKEPVIAVTGTNGKTTTTTLLGEVFRKAFSGVFVGGNIGNPLMNYVLEGRKARYVILEISSFQLETIETFRPEVAILLNITEDHLDRYRSYDEYISAKWRIFENQTDEDYALINSALKPPEGIRSRILPFSTREALDSGAFLMNGTMCVRVKGQEFTYDRAISPLYGIHNTENILSVLLTAHLYDIDRGIIEETLRTFKGLPHRVEFVRELKGVSFYNDSKATNVDATRRAVEGIGAGVVLIAGGKDKGGSYEAMRMFRDKIKALVLVGEAKKIIFAALGNDYATYMEDNLEKAVERAVDVAAPGDVVLFSPMCSSFDMFRDYRERGEIFKHIVESL
jgi:UDP-N-acetylmuramoylalanine--D-glutamate ligase